MFQETAEIHVVLLYEGQKGLTGQMGVGDGPRTRKGPTTLHCPVLISPQDKAQKEIPPRQTTMPASQKKPIRTKLAKNKSRWWCIMDLRLGLRLLLWDLINILFIMLTLQPLPRKKTMVAPALIPEIDKKAKASLHRNTCNVGIQGRSKYYQWLSFDSKWLSPRKKWMPLVVNMRESRLDPGWVRC